MEGKTYGYVRVSTQVQNEARQLTAMREFGVPEENIIIEKQSGKDFRRPRYQSLVGALRTEDVLVVKSIDRLGRNYTEILEQWSVITKKRKAAIVVLDMPLLDTRQGRDLTGTFIRTLYSRSSAMLHRRNGKISGSGRPRESLRRGSGAACWAGSASSSRRISVIWRSCGRRAASRPETRPESWGSPTRPSCAERKSTVPYRTPQNIRPCRQTKQRPVPSVGKEPGAFFQVSIFSAQNASQNAAKSSRFFAKQAKTKTKNAVFLLQKVYLL